MIAGVLKMRPSEIQLNSGKNEESASEEFPLGVGSGFTEGVGVTSAKTGFTAKSDRHKKSASKAQRRFIGEIHTGSSKSLMSSEKPFEDSCYC